MRDVYVQKRRNNYQEVSRACTLDLHSNVKAYTMPPLPRRRVTASSDVEQLYHVNEPSTAKNDDKSSKDERHGTRYKCIATV